MQSTILQLAEALQKNTQITSLDLSDNQIGEQGAEVHYSPVVPSYLHVIKDHAEQNCFINPTNEHNN